jgi:hypothetical protein
MSQTKPNTPPRGFRINEEMSKYIARQAFAYQVKSAARARSMSLLEIWKAHRAETSPNRRYSRWSMRQYIARRSMWF